MSLEPENAKSSASLAGEPDQGIAGEPVAERIRFIFRQAGDNAPAIELEQQITTYRLLAARQ